MTSKIFRRKSIIFVNNRIFQLIVIHYTLKIQKSADIRFSMFETHFRPHIRIFFIGNIDLESLFVIGPQ